MTLFAEAAANPAERADFQVVLDKFYDGLEDRLTLEMLSAAG